jgi:hypothetical protein
MDYVLTEQSCSREAMFSVACGEDRVSRRAKRWLIGIGIGVVCAVLYLGVRELGATNLHQHVGATY